MRKWVRGIGVLLWILGLAGIPDNVQGWWGWLAMLEPYIDSWLIRVALSLVGLLAFTYPQWLLYLTSRKAKVSDPTSLPHLKPEQETSKRDVSFIDGVYYVATRSWEDVTTEPGISLLGSALDQVLQRAADGDITVWGKVSRHGAQFVQLPIEYWHTARIELMRLLQCDAKDDHESLGTEQVFDAKTVVDPYYCLRLTKSQIESVPPVVEGQRQR